MGLVDWTFLQVFCRCVQLNLWDSIVCDLVLWRLGKQSLGSFTSIISILATLARHLVCRSDSSNTVLSVFWPFIFMPLHFLCTTQSSTFCIYVICCFYYLLFSLLFYYLYVKHSFICACTLLLCIVQYIWELLRRC